MPRKEDNLQAIEAILRGENTSGWSDNKMILVHARAMQRQIKQLEEALKFQSAQLSLFTEKEIRANQFEPRETT